MTTGMNNPTPLETGSLVAMFEKQKTFQEHVTGLQCPVDDVSWYKYHMLALIEEAGEVLKADKRWKTHRNTRYEPDEKLDEIADVFITAINVSLFSGFDGNEIFNAVIRKIQENENRLEKEK